ncbi:MAG: hypothetical protein KGI11_08495 [Thaumarchaeota archaeon]|nr:hypothetical protein [Nitrososphaerota archaeon]
MSESKTKKGELPDLLGYVKWNPKKKRFDSAHWWNPRKYPQDGGNKA